MAETHNKYTDEIARAICDDISTTQLSLSKICAKHGVSKVSLYAWKTKHPEFEKMYITARRRQIEIFIDEIVDLIDDMQKKVTGDQKGNYAYVKTIELEIRTKQWLAMKLLPRVYGDTGLVMDDVQPDEDKDIQAIRDARESYKKQTKKEY